MHCAQHAGRGSIQSAVAEGEKKRLDEAKERAASLRKLLAAIRKIDGKAEVGSRLNKSFEAYFAASVETAELFLGIKQGDQAVAIPKMQTALRTLESELKAARFLALNAAGEAARSLQTAVATFKLS